MELQTLENKTVSQNDILKGQKIIAAAYLVTDHLSDTTPLKRSIRQAAEALATSSGCDAEGATNVFEILMGAAVLAGFVSEKNSSIIVYEAKRYSASAAQSTAEASVAGLFAPAQASDTHRAIGTFKRTVHPQKAETHILSFMKNDTSEKSADKLSQKITRQDKILAFINDKKSAVIKDITALFPDVSEKTVQRELNVLIENGRITKRGSKRWSIYMAVSSLL